VTGYVTSSHGAATPLRYGVTGHLAGNLPVRSRQAIVAAPSAAGRLPQSVTRRIGIELLAAPGHWCVVQTLFAIDHVQQWLR
jgi:hypothetical protein